MKKILYVVILLFAICFIAIATKPSDETILNKVNEQITIGVRKDGGDLAADVVGLIAGFGEPYVFRIEDHLLYKTVYIKYTNRVVAKAYFGCVFTDF